MYVITELHLTNHTKASCPEEYFSFIIYLTTMHIGEGSKIDTKQASPNWNSCKF